MEEKFFKEENQEIEESIKMVEKKKKKKKKVNKRAKVESNDFCEDKQIAKSDVKLSTPAGTLKIKKGEDCSKYSASIIKRLILCGAI